MRKLLQIVITPHFFPEKTVLYSKSSSRPLNGQIMIQMQNQLQPDIELAQHLCIGWLIAAMTSICCESQYNRSNDNLKQCVGFLPGPACR